MIKAVLFDVFGTLLDVSTDDYYSPYSHVVAPLKLSEADRIRAGRMLCTMSFPSINDFADHLERTFPGQTIPTASRDAAAVELEKDLDRMVTVNGVDSLLPELKRAGFKLALVSNLANTYERTIRRHAIDRLVDTTIYSFEVGYRKPELRIFEIALERIGTEPEETVMIGDDRLNDGEGAKSAGLHVRIVESGSEDAGESLKKAIQWALANA